MAADLVRVRFRGVEKNMSRSLAESSEGVEILDEPTTRGDGRLLPTTRANGRARKPKTSVAKAAEKKAATAAASKAVTPASSEKE